MKGFFVSPFRNVKTKASTIYTNRLYLPSHLGIYLRDGFTLRPGTPDLRRSLQSAIDWLVYAQDVGRGGVAGNYSFARGWSAPYPETTGYITPTMFDYYHLTGQEIYRKRAILMSDWELMVQLPEGAFPGGYTDSFPKPIVFNTGQVLQGLVRAYSETSDEKYKVAAQRAGDWLIEIQDPDGAWRRCTYRNTFHTYHTRVAWPLYQLYQITYEDRYAIAAEKNLRWALQNQLPNGWFKSNALYLHSDDALTHSIAYAIRGFLESGLIASNKEYILAAKKASEVLLDKFESTGRLQASYNHDWRSNDEYSCVTGDAQISGIWLRLFEITGKDFYARAAFNMNAVLRATQNISSRNRGIRGGIKGSEPIYGRYMPYRYLNWATKFFVDALILEEKTRAALS